MARIRIYYHLACLHFGYWLIEQGERISGITVTGMKG